MGKATGKDIEEWMMQLRSGTMNEVSLGAVRQRLSERGFWAQTRRGCRRTIWACVGVFVGPSIVTVFMPLEGWRSALTVVINISVYVAVVAILGWLTSAFMMWWLLGKLRWGVFAPKTRREHLLRIYDRGLATARAHDLHMVRVVHVYQVSRRGTKCIVKHPKGVRQDAWFWSHNPKRGCVFMVRSTTGYGPHNSNMQVMYIGTGTTGHGVVGGMPAAAWKAGRRERPQ